MSRTNPNLVAVAWREYGLPINTNGGAGPGERTAECHVSVSTNGGITFHDTNLMPYLRQNTGDPELPTEPAPGLYYCNAPWVAIGDDGAIYAGGSVFTPLGDRNWFPARGTDAPKQGRALVTVSTDNGQSWSPPTFGIKVSNFAPGVTGLGCSNNLPCVSSPPGTDQWHTPWDGAIGVFAPGSTTFYSKAGALFSASEDHAQTFGPAYQIRVPGWTFSTGKIDASGNKLVVPIIASVTPLGATCPCLAMATSSDKGATWTATLIAEAGEFNPSGTGDTAHYPFAAADPTAASSYAVAVYTPDRTSMQVFWTENDGATWQRAPVGPVPVAETVARAGKIGVGYTSDGRILAVWRAFYAPDDPTVPGGPGSFDTFAALLQGDSFGPSVKVSPQPSRYPTLTTIGTGLPNAANYMLNNGGGDFSTFITGNNEFAFVGFPYAPGDPNTSSLDTYFAKVPLALMEYPHMVLRMVPNVLNLRTTAGMVTAVLTADTGDLASWNIRNLRLHGALPVSVGLSSDRRTLVATFNKDALQTLPAGSTTVSVTGEIERDGLASPFSASATVRVLRLPGVSVSFFVSSATSATGNLGGLAGADATCQRLGASIGQGARTWRAYLSVEHGPNGQPVHARDRIGSGPWYNANHELIANNLSELHSRTGNAALFVDERGQRINGQWTGSPRPVEHDILTGSNADGTVRAGATCSDWTSAATDVTAQVGHSDGLGPNQNATPPLSSWNSAHTALNCSNTAPRGGSGRIYCFAP